MRRSWPVIATLSTTCTGTTLATSPLVSSFISIGSSLAEPLAEGGSSRPSTISSWTDTRTGRRAFDSSRPRTRTRPSSRPSLSIGTASSRKLDATAVCFLSDCSHSISSRSTPSSTATGGSLAYSARVCFPRSATASGVTSPWRESSTNGATPITTLLPHRPSAGKTVRTTPGHASVSLLTWSPMRTRCSQHVPLTTGQELANRTGCGTMCSTMPGPPSRWRTDAIHLAAAQVVGADLRAVVTYDRRMAEAARDLGLAVERPG